MRKSPTKGFDSPQRKSSEMQPSRTSFFNKISGEMCSSLPQCHIQQLYTIGQEQRISHLCTNILFVCLRAVSNPFCKCSAYFLLQVTSDWLGRVWCNGMFRELHLCVLQLHSTNIVLVALATQSWSFTGCVLLSQLTQQ